MAIHRYPGVALLMAAVVEGQQPLLTNANNATTVPIICAEDEELFRLQLITEDAWQGAPASYRIFTESSSTTHAECEQCSNRSPGADVQICLPKDECHTALVGRNVGRWISCFNGGVEELVMTWGGEVIRRNNAYLFESIDFGDGCQASYCDDDNG